MAGISSSAITNAAPNAYKANGGTELGSGEWANGSGLELYETTYRSYDAQIGRFMQVDPEMESSANSSGYVFVNDNPVMFVDPLGLLLQKNVPGPSNQGIGDDDPDGLWDDGDGGSGGGGGGGFFNYMDGNGNKWHHADPLAGTASAGQQYIEGNGWDGFGNTGNNGFVTGEKKTTRNGVEGYYISYTGVGAAGNGHELLQEVVIDNKFVAFDQERPDADGYLTYKEANDWYRNGNGQPLTVDLDKITLTGVYESDFKGVGSKLRVNLLMKISPEDMLLNKKRTMTQRYMVTLH